MASVTTKGLAAVVALGALFLVTGAAKPAAPPPEACEPDLDLLGAQSSALPELPLDAVPEAALAPPAPTDEASDVVATGHAERPLAAGVCPSDMVLVEGSECAEVEEPCLAWATEAPGEEPKMRCLRFGPSRCVGARKPARFCIDRYEYPNLKGRLPVVMKTWTEASTLCAVRGRRLCKGAEWTLACEGEERLPYPYGFVRDDSACNTDRPLAGPYPRMITHPPRGIGISLVDWRAPSGEMDRCTSPFGVHDMTGNVDEWVVNESGHPYDSGLKGGYWGPVRDRCRPMTIAHDEQFAFYQIGFRCCADAPTPRATRR